MNCNLIIKDPFLKDFTEKEEFTSYDDFVETFKASVTNKNIVPLNVNGTMKFYKVTFTENFLNIKLDTQDNVDSELGELSKYYNKSANTIAIHRNSIADFYFTALSSTPENFISTAQGLINKYSGSNEISLVEDNEFIKTMLNFYNSNKGAMNNVEGLEDIVNDLSNLQQEVQKAINIWKGDFKDYDAVPENGSAYVFTNLPLLFKKDKQNAEIDNEVDIVRLQIGRSLGNKDNVYVRLEKDSENNLQTGDPSTFEMGVVGVLYDNDGNRLYVKNTKDVGVLNKPVQFTTDINEAYQFKNWDGSKTSNLTLIVPIIENGFYHQYMQVDPNAIRTIMDVRDKVNNTGQSSPMFKVKDPIKRPIFRYVPNGDKKQFQYISLSEFLSGKNYDRLFIADDTYGKIYNGSMVLMVDNELVPTFRTSLDKNEIDNVINIIDYINNTDNSRITEVVDYLNKLLSFKGSSVSFFERKGKIVSYGYFTKLKTGKVVKNEKAKLLSTEELQSVLDFAKINVDKQWLDNQSIPYVSIEDGKFTIQNIDSHQWYLDHHKTHRRMIEVNGKPLNTDLQSVHFDVFNAKTVEVEKPSSKPVIPIVTPGVYTVEDIYGQHYNSFQEESSLEVNRMTDLIIALGSDKIKNISIEFVQRDPNFKGGVIDGKIYINSNIQDKGLLSKVIAHETIHALTSTWINENSESNEVKRLNEIAKKVSKKFPYVNNAHELLAHLTDSEVVQYLQNTKSKNKTLLSEFKEIVQKILSSIFNNKQASDTLYAEVVDLFVKAVDDYNPLTGQNVGVLEAGVSSQDLLNQKISISGTSEGFRGFNIPKGESVADFRRRNSDGKFEVILDKESDRDLLFTDIKLNGGKSYAYRMKDRSTGETYYIVGITSRVEGSGLDGERNGTLFASIKDTGNLPVNVRTILENRLIKEFEKYSEEQKKTFGKIPQSFIDSVKNKLKTSNTVTSTSNPVSNINKEDVDHLKDLLGDIDLSDISGESFFFDPESAASQLRANHDKVFLKRIVTTLDADLANFLLKSGRFSSFINRSLNFDQTFNNILTTYIKELKGKSSLSNAEKIFFKFILDKNNYEGIKQVWKEDTSLFKIVKTSGGSVDSMINNSDEVETTDANPQDQSVEDAVQEDSDVITAEIKESVDNQKLFDRNPNEYNFKEADPIVRSLFKMIPQIERVNGEVVIYENAPEIAPGVIDPKYFKTPHGYIKSAENEFGRLKLNDLLTTWNMVSELFKDKLSIEQMFNDTYHNPRTIDIAPEVYVLLSWYQDKINDSASIEDAEILIKIEKSFKRFSNDLWIVLEQDNRMIPINEGKDAVSIAKNVVNTRFVKNAVNNLAQYLGDNNSQFNLKKYLEDLNFDKSKVLTDRNTVQKIVNDLGFHTKYEGNESFDFGTSLANFLLDYAKYSEWIPVIDIAQTITTDQTFEKSTIEGRSARFKELFTKENEVNPMVTSQMQKNAEGENQSVNSLPNNVLQSAHLLSTSSTYEELVQRLPRAKNPVFRRSLIYKQLFDDKGTHTGKKIDVINYNGLKTTIEDAASKGDLTVGLSDEDWIRMAFVTLHEKGFIENNRAETASTSYGYIFDWGLNQITPLTDNDVKSQFENGQFEVNVDSKLFTIFKNYLIGEIESGTLNHSKGQNLFNFLSAKLRSKLTNEAAVETNKLDIAIELTEWFNNDFSKFDYMFETVAGGIESVLKNSTVANKVKQQGKIEPELVKYAKWFAYLNTVVLHIEEVLAFNGDFSQHDNFFKRAKSAQSGRTPVTGSPAMRGVINKQLAENSFGKYIGTPFELGQTFTSATMQDLEVPSPNLNKMKSDFIESLKMFNESLGVPVDEKSITQDSEKLLKAYENTTISDGQAWINPDFYFSLLEGTGNITNEQRIGFNALVYDMIYNKDKYFTQEEKDMFNFPTLTESQIEEMRHGLNLIEDGHVVFPSLKWTYRGNSIDDKVIADEYLDKFSLFPLFIQYVYDKPILKKTLIGFLRDNIGYTKFKTGTKLSTTAPIDVMNQEGPVIDFMQSSHTLLTDSLGEQIKTPNYVKEKNTFGSQFRKLIISGLKNLSGDDLKLVNESVPGQFVRDWERVMQDFSATIEEKVLSDFGINKKDGVWDYSNLDIVKISDMMIRGAKQRDLSDNVIDFFEGLKNGDYSNIESSFNQKEVQNILASIIKDIAIQKLYGAQMIQVSSAGHDDFNGRKLGWYEMGKKAECKVSMMGDFKNLFNLNEVKQELKKIVNPTYLDKLAILNNLLKDDEFVKRHEDALTVVLYRIPTQGLNSMDVMVVREFLPSFQSPQIVLPAEIVVKSGTDYDYDKESVITPTIGHDGKIYTDLSEGKSLEELNQEYDKLMSDLESVFEMKDTLKRFRNLVNNEEQFESLTEDEFEQFLFDSTDMELQMVEQYEALKQEHQHELNKLYRLKNQIKSITKNKGKVLQNSMIKTASNILLDPVNYFKLITPNSSEIVFNEVDKVLSKLYPDGASSGKPKGMNIVSPWTNYLKWRVVKGKNLLGIAAVGNTLFSLMQRYNFQFNNEYIIQLGKKFKSLEVKTPLLTKAEQQSIIKDDKFNVADNFTADNVSKLELLSQFINVTVDMPSDDRFGYLNFTQENFGAVIYLTLVQGVPFSRILNLFHQPIIYKYNKLVKDYTKMKSPVSGELYSRKAAQAHALADLFDMEVPIKDSDFGPYEDINGFFNEFYDEVGLAEDRLQTTLEKIGHEKLNGSIPAFSDSLTAFDRLSSEKKRNQRDVLSHYVNVLNQSDVFRKVGRTINFDTSPDNNLMKTLDREDTYTEVGKSNFIDMKYLNTVISNSVISGLNTSPIMRGLSKNLFKALYSDLSLQTFKVASNEVFNKETYYKKIANDFLSAIVQNFATADNKDFYQVSYEHLIGDKRFDLFNQAQQIKDDFAKEGKYYRILNILLLNASKKRTPAVNNVQLFMGFENTSDDKNLLIEEFRQLLNNPKTKDFAENLAITGIVQAGYQQSPLFFSDLIPNEFISPIINDAVQTYLDLPIQYKRTFVQGFMQAFSYNEGGLFNKLSQREAYRFKNYSNKSVDFKKELVRVLPMIPTNIEKIKTGEKTVTSRTDNLESNAFLLTDGTKIEIENRTYYPNISHMENPESWAKKEGFKSLEDMRKNAKFQHTKDFIDGKRDLWVFDIKVAEANTTQKSVTTDEKVIPQQFTNHSGGALGADSEWDSIGREFGVNNHKHYWTEQVTPKGNTEISKQDFEEGKYEAAKAAKRNYGYSYNTMKNSKLIRNWNQVKYSDAVFAIGSIVKTGEKLFPNQINDSRIAIVPSVTGGTGYAVGMAILNNKPVYVFNQSDNSYDQGWYKWDEKSNDFISINTPILTKNFAGIGTREINKAGKQAIRDVYRTTLQDNNQNFETVPTTTNNDEKNLNFVEPVTQDQQTSIKDFVAKYIGKFSGTVGRIISNLSATDAYQNLNEVQAYLQKELDKKNQYLIDNPNIPPFSLESVKNDIQGIQEVMKLINQELESDYLSFVENLNNDAQSVNKGKSIVVPENSKSSNLPIFETEDQIFLMNDGQQATYEGIKEFVLNKLKNPETITKDKVLFTEPLSQEYSGIIPTAMWNNMIGIIGQGGVGKTTVLKKIIDDIIEEYEKTYRYRDLNVLYLGPTHNAVTMLQESLGLDSEQVSGNVKTWASATFRNQQPDSLNAEKGKPGEELLLLSKESYEEQLEKGFIKPISSNDVIVVDESSMLSGSDIEDLLFRLRSEGINKFPVFIFMGDYRQLPPVTSDSNKTFKEGIISATLFSDKNTDKHFTLTQVMRSKNLQFHKIFNSVGDQITQQRKDFNQGKSIKPFDFKVYDEASKSSSEDILIVNENNTTGMINDYADVLSRTDNPYEMFWVHYNNIRHANTKSLFDKIRETYFTKLGQEIPVDENFVVNDYVQYTGSLPLSTTGTQKYQKGTVKPGSRLKVLERGFETTDLYNLIPIPQFRGVQVPMEFVVLYNRQGRKRIVYALKDNLISKTEYNKETKRMEVTVNNKVYEIPYAEFKKSGHLFKESRRGLNQMFKPSYIGSSHTVQGASIKKVIVGDYNVRKNAPNIALRDMESSLYVSLTRASEKLIIIKPSSIEIENNQEVFNLNKPESNLEQTDNNDSCIPM